MKITLDISDGSPGELTTSILSLITKHTEKQAQTPTPEWKDFPNKKGFYTFWTPGAPVEVVYWGGEDDPALENMRQGKYFGPYRLPV